MAVAAASRAVWGMAWPMAGPMAWHGGGVCLWRPARRRAEPSAEPVNTRSLARHAAPPNRQPASHSAACTLAVSSRWAWQAGQAGLVLPQQHRRHDNVAPRTARIIAPNVLLPPLARCYAAAGLRRPARSRRKSLCNCASPAVAAAAIGGWRWWRGRGRSASGVSREGRRGEEESARGDTPRASRGRRRRPPAGPRVG